MMVSRRDHALFPTLSLILIVSTVIHQCLAERELFDPATPAPCPVHIPKLEVIPGFGWDGLKSEDLGRVIRVSYDKCKTTDDGRYLIPDNTDAITIKTNELQLNAELIQHWTNYSTITARSFKAGVELGWNIPLLSLDASFSADYQLAKNSQVKEKTVNSRVHIRNTLYRLISQPDAKLVPALHDQFLEALRAIRRNHIEKARYLLEVVVRDYGTHFVRRVEAGAIFVKEDFISSVFIAKHDSESNKISAAARLAFLAEFKLQDLKLEANAGFDHTMDNTLLSSYKANRISQRIRAIGGPTYNSKMAVDEWLARTAENLVTIDRSGDLLPQLVTPSKFPNAPPMMLKQLHQMLTEAVTEYYRVNTHEGCTHADSPNFDYSANLDDGSCRTATHNYSFGGVYQYCAQISNKDKTTSICSGLLQANPLTGGYSCPTGFSDKLLHSRTISRIYRENHPYERCKGWWFWKKCETKDNWKSWTITAVVKSQWCITSSKSDKSNSNIRPGYLFGGVYSPETVNIITKSKACPATFFPLHLLGNNRLTICVSNDVPQGRHYAIPFAGFTGCKVHDHCPNGYTGHLATIFEGCQINYCVQGASLSDKFPIMPLHRPPFRNGSAIFQDDEDYIADNYDEYGTAKQLHVEVYNGGTVGNYIGVIISLSIFVLLVVFAVAYWQRKQAVEYFRHVLETTASRLPKDTSRQRTISGSSNGPLLHQPNTKITNAWMSVNKEFQSHKPNLKSTKTAV